MPKPLHELAGECAGCAGTLADLAHVLERAVARERAGFEGMPPLPEKDARLHALAAFLSFWLNATLDTFPNDGTGPKAARVCIRNVFAEQGLENTHQVLAQLADALERTPREGADRDEPEGARIVRLSDTVARALVQAIRRELGGA